MEGVRGEWCDGWKEGGNGGGETCWCGGRGVNCFLSNLSGNSFSSIFVCFFRVFLLLPTINCRILVSGRVSADFVVFCDRVVRPM